jgi:HEAT repeat protein
VYPAIEISAARRLSVAFEQTPLAEALKAIAEQAGLRLRLRGDFLTPVTMSLVNIPLDEAIKRLTRGNSVCLFYEAAGRAGSATLAAVWVFERPPSRTDERARPFGLRDVRALARRGDTAAITALGDLVLHARDPVVRGHAAFTLGSLAPGHPSALAALTAALYDRAQNVRRQALRAITRLEGERALSLVRGLALGDEDRDVRCEATRALAAFRSPEARRALEAAYKDHDPSVQREAARGLARWRGSAR